MIIMEGSRYTVNNSNNKIHYIETMKSEKLLYPSHRVLKTPYLLISLHRAHYRIV